MKPNIVIILIDGLRAKNLSLYGYPEEHDTSIKKIARDSVIFNNHFSCANNTYTSLTSLFTGKFPPNHGIIHTYPYTSKEQLEALKQNKFWLPTYLSAKGYETYFLSLSKLWLKKGFTYQQETPKKDAYRKVNDKKLIRIALKLMPDWTYVLLKKIARRDPNKTDFPKPQETVDLAIEKLQNQDKSKPFFMFMHFEDVHYPWANTPTPQVEGLTTTRKILKTIPSKNQKKYVKRRMFNSNSKTIEQVEAKYNRALEIVDKEVGRFHNYLSDKKLLDNTIFIIMADHGFSIAEHGIYLDHANIYDETMHVPLIIQSPKLKPKTINALVQNIDIAPTIIDLLKQKPIEIIDGKSLTHLIKNNKSIRSIVFAFDGSSQKRWAARSKDKKVIFAHDPHCFACNANLGEPIELYDLKNDPNELNNIHTNQYELQEFSKKFKF